ncbi:ribonuclease H-like domain-containing protein [Absidia repens]|uniref:Ribonuclease H n=1 Tax=Absidia repens TaxID=90262 RepID=A0A1X2I1E5_9FUNG|nr:ribonuclease H-like domain-containing protein [Absidia repens]
MGGQKRFYYAVQKGHRQGVYSTWDECRSNVHGFSGAKYKKFNTKEEAESFANQQPSSSSSSSSSNYDAYSSSSKRSSSSYPSYSSSSYYRDDDDYPPPRRYNTTVASPSRSPTFNYSYSTKRKRSVEDDDPPSMAAATTAPGKAIKLENKAIKVESSHPNRSSSSISSSSSNKVVYTDGASRGNGRVGAKAGYGVWWGDGDARNVSGPLEGKRQTNQRAEATAILKVLEQTQHMNDGLEIHTDSQYCIKAMTEWHKGWIKKGWKSSTGDDVQNRDLFEPMLRLVNSRQGKTKFVYVPGHKGIYGNERADALAVAGAESQSFKVKKEE